MPKMDITSDVVSTTIRKAEKKIEENLEEIDALLRLHLTTVTDGGEVLPLAALTQEILDNLKAGHGLVLPTPQVHRGALMLDSADNAPTPPPTTPSPAEVAGQRLIALVGEGDVDQALGLIGLLSRRGLTVEKAVERIDAFQAVNSNPYQVADLVAFTAQVATSIKDGDDAIKMTAGKRYLKSLEKAQEVTATVQRGFDKLVEAVFTKTGNPVPAWTDGDQREKIVKVTQLIERISAASAATAAAPSAPRTCTALDDIGKKLSTNRGSKDDPSYGKDLVAAVEALNAALANDKKRAQAIARKNNFTVPAEAANGSGFKILEALIKHTLNDNNPLMRHMNHMPIIELP